jgi:Fe-S-cluster containining protein
VSRDSRPKGPRTHCIRCGTCCTKGGPTLHQVDAPLFAKGRLGRRHVYTLRKGEVVRNIDENLMALDQEMIKIKGAGETWSCIFYDEDRNACRIYTDRPLECRALQCWDLQELKKAMAEPCLQRNDLIKPDNGLRKLVEAHEMRCSYAVLESSVRALGGAKADVAVQEILDLMQYDHTMRPFLEEKLKIDPAEMDFLFGRPLTTTIRMFGLHIKEEDGAFTLLPID